MPRGLWPSAVILAVGAASGLFIHRGVYQSHLLGDGETVVAVNRFTGRAFRIHDGLREPVEPSTLENRVAKYFERLHRSTPAAAVSVEKEISLVRPAGDQDPFAGLRANPDFKLLSPSAQFDMMKRYAAYMLQPSPGRVLPVSDQKALLERMVKGLLSHPYAQALSDEEKMDLREYYSDLAAGRS